MNVEINKQQLNKTILLITLLLGSKSHAFINMKNASFTQTWKDESSDINFKIKRTYSSRSLYNGKFGFGWCSNIESRLHFKPNGHIEFFECDTGAKYIFTPTTSQKRQLATNKTLFFVNSKLQEFITKNRNIYTLYRKNGTLIRFNQKGHITFVLNPNGTFQKYSYHNDQLIKINNNDKEILLLSYSSLGKITLIKSHHLTINYIYNGEDLTGIQTIKSDNTQTISYTYDSLHNLTTIMEGQQITHSIQYNSDNDWVQQVQKNGCTQQLNYKLINDLHYITSVTNTCNDQVTSQTHLEFVHRSLSERTTVLDRVLVKNGERTLTYLLNP